MKQFRNLLLGSGLAVLALSACTKELPYQEKFVKNDVQEKSLLSDKDEYIYSSQVQNISRSSSDALPFSSSDNKRVKLQWTKDALRVVETERDARFKANTTNDKLVLEIPVDYVQYECAKDKYGECTNSEEEKGDAVSWDKKPQFKFKLEAAKSATTELLPILSDKSFGGDCYTEVTSKVIGINVDKDSLNMDIERTFLVNAAGHTAEGGSCASHIEGLSDLTTTAVFHYSMVKADSVLTKGFQPVTYPDLDENTFGFFSTKLTQLDTDNNNTVESQIKLMNHWSPNRKQIDYYLSDEFAKPEYKTIKDLTYKTVDAINTGLSEAGAQFRLNLHEPAGKNPGDIRNSMIVLVEDPVASSVIGYGPQTEDPATGEIISARTIMFMGTIKKYIKYTYDDILREQKAQALAAQNTPAKTGDGKAPAGGATTAGSVNLSLDDDLMKAQIKNALYRSKSINALATSPVVMTAQADSTKNASVAASSSKTTKTFATGVNKNAKISDVMRDIRRYTKSTNSRYSTGPNAAIRYLREVKNCAFGADSDLPTSKISPRLLKMFPNAKPWEQLSQAEKDDVLAKLLPEIWIPTLIHEMGHNLGLRHNFAGSEDKANYYSSDELAKKGIDHAVPFSTVMEYGDDLKTLSVMGKYDVAALKFAYAQKVQLADNSWVSVKGTLADTLKPALDAAKQQDPMARPEDLIKRYGYCTDEHTGINAGCRRFDLGASYTEIVQNEIQTYKNAYARRNLRADRASMSLYDDPAYASRIYDTFFGLRLMQEVYERLQYAQGWDDNNKYWNVGRQQKDASGKCVPFNPDAGTPYTGAADGCPVIADSPADLKDASALSTQFLLSVIATPDLNCVVAEKATGGIVEVAPISVVGGDFIDCFAIPLKPEYVMKGQFGHLLQSKKDPASDNHYADQIDVRGYWIDKAMAVRALFQRSFGISSLDAQTDNLMDRTDLAPDISAMVQGALLNQLAADVDVQYADGSSEVATIPVDMSNGMVDKSIFDNPDSPMNDMATDMLATSMGLPSGFFLRNSFNFTQLLTASMVQNMVDNTHLTSGRQVADSVKVSKWSTASGNSISKDAKTFTIGSIQYIAMPQNTIAYQAMQDRENALILEKVDQKRLKDLVGLKTAPPPVADPKDLTDDEKAVWAMDPKVVQSYLDGVLKDSSFYEDLINKLPGA